MSIAAEVAQLEQSIKLGAPTIAGDLVKVLKQLHGRPELVHMLSEEGIGVIVSGLLTTKALEDEIKTFGKLTSSFFDAVPGAKRCLKC